VQSTIFTIIIYTNLCAAQEHIQEVPKMTTLYNLLPTFPEWLGFDTKNLVGL